MAVNLSRRWFLGGALAVAGATVLPSLPKAYPRIVGDGIHDDTLGLQAALDGKTFVCGDKVVCGAQEIILKHGKYLVTDTLRISKTVALIGESGGHGMATLVAGHDGVFLRFDNAENCIISHLCFEPKNPMQFMAG